MDYFRLFNLEKEPFANTPDPEFFYRSTRHARCMQNVELAIRLRRGLCIVRGEVGTGKTTLCRQLIRTLSDDESMDVHLVLDPGYNSTQEFAAAVGRMIAGRHKADNCATIADFKEMIKNHLFDAGVDGGKTIVLIIDEGQKLAAGCAEFLRELLNYETNTHKLLQIVIFAQNEIRELLFAHPGFADRAALYHRLEPLDRKETARLIEHRLKKAGASGKAPGGPHFTRRAVSAIYRISRGYPRTTIHLAHNILLLLLVKGAGTVTPRIVRRAAAGLPDVKKTPPAGGRLKAAGFVFAAAVISLAVMAAYPGFLSESGPEKKEAASSEKTSVQADHAAYEILTRKQEPAAETEKEIPETLGTITITENDRLWNVLKRIYGAENPGDVMQRVQAANAELQSPNMIRPGQEITLPAADEGSVSESQRYWIALEKSRDLNTVYRAAAAEPDGQVRVISYWHPDTGIEHAAVKKGAFPEQSKAEQTIDSMEKSSEKAPFVLDLSKKATRLLTAGGRG